MKYILLVFVLGILSSCCMMNDGFRFDEPHFGNMLEACEWIHENIKYQKSERWQTAQQTIEKGKGDCADMAVLLMSICAYQHCNYISYYLKLETDTIENGKRIQHAVVEYNNEYYDCTKGEKVSQPKNIISKHDYTSTMESFY